MKEQEIIFQNPRERLTNQAHNLRLERGGNIFMAENQGEQVKVAREAWQKANEGREVGAEEIKAQERLIEMGFPPVSGGAGEQAQRTNINFSNYPTEILLDIARHYNVRTEASGFLGEQRQLEKDLLDPNLSEEQKKELTEKLRTTEERLRRAVEFRLESFFTTKEQTTGVNSMQELLSAITTEGSKWKDARIIVASAKNAKEKEDLLSKYKEKILINEDGRVNQDNFLRWLREQMMEHHGNSPDGNINLFSDIGIRIPGYVSPLPFMEMYVWRRKYFYDEKEGKYLEDLATQALYEVWLFNTNHNNDVAYRLKGVMGNDQKLPETIAEIYWNDVFTKFSGGKSTFERIFTLPENMTESDGKIGNAIRTAVLSYYYISDLDKLREILGEDAALFRRKYKTKDKEGKDVSEDTVIARDPFAEKGSYRGMEERWFDGDNEADKKKLRSEVFNGKDAEARDKFLEFMNPFTSSSGAQKDPGIINETRAKIRQSLKERLGLGDNDAEYAESWAYYMCRWTGLAAMNDTKAIAFDAWTKIQQTEYYRLRQKEYPREGGSLSGNPFNIDGFKRLGLNFWNGITDEKGRTPIEILEGHAPGEVKENGEIKQILRENPFSDKNHAKFPAWVMQYFAGDHVARSFQLYHFLIENNELNFQNLVTREVDPVTGLATGRLVVDFEKANKVVDGINKAIRYAYSTWGGIDYGKKVRTWEKYWTGEKDQRKEHFIHKEETTMEMMFGKGIYRLIRDFVIRTHQSSLDRQTLDAIKKGEKDDIVAGIMQSQDRGLVWKFVLEYAFIKEVESHRNPHSPFQRFKFADLENIYDFIRSVGLFNEEEIKNIKKRTRTTSGRLVIGEGFGAALTGSGGGVFKEFKKFVASLFK
ncbi:hypothetical protein M1615_04720 [Patescibacteria group bacterium]|nr:hypothetical protein [Patescibacteria group bacterium]